jgi:hypothetical protein
MITLMANAAPPDSGGEVPSPAAVLNGFLSDLLGSTSVLKLGFGFGYDLSRLQRSYPNLTSAGAFPHPLLGST